MYQIGHCCSAVIFVGLAMMLSLEVGRPAFRVGESTQVLALPGAGIPGHFGTPSWPRSGAWKGACRTLVVGARESPFPALLCPLAEIWLDSTRFRCTAATERPGPFTPHHGLPKTRGRLRSSLNPALWCAATVPEFRLHFRVVCSAAVCAVWWLQSPTSTMSAIWPHQDVICGADGRLMKFD